MGHHQDDQRHRKSGAWSQGQDECKASEAPWGPDAGGYSPSGVDSAPAHPQEDTCLHAAPEYLFCLPVVLALITWLG